MSCTTRLVATILMFVCPATLLAQAQNAWIEQFDGKKLQGWEIDGESKIENGVLTLGGKIETKMRLSAPLGEQFELRLECQYAGSVPTLRFATSAPVNERPLAGMPGHWAEFTLQRARGNLGFGYVLSQTFRHLDDGGMSSGGLPPGSGDVRELTIIVRAGSTLTIRRMVLQTTPPGEGPGAVWVPVAVLVLVLLGIMGLGWFLNRRRAESPSSRAAP